MKHFRFFVSPLASFISSKNLKNMNLKLSIAAPLCLCFAQIFAQVPAVTEAEKLMSLGTRPAIRVELPNAKQGYVEDLWADFLKKELGEKPKWDKKNKQSLAADVNAPVISAAGPVDFYSRVEESSGGATFTLWLDTGMDDFVSSRVHPESYREAEAMVARFSKAVRMQQVADQLKAEEKRQKDLDNDLRKLQKEKDSLEKDIENWKKKIAKAEDDLKANASDQVKKQAEIEQQIKAVSNVQERMKEVERGN